MLQNLCVQALIHRLIRYNKRFPAVWVVPLVVFCVCCALGVYGTVAGANDYVQTQKQQATATATDTAATFKLTVEQTFTPLVTLSTFIKQQPNFTEFAPGIPAIGAELLKQVCSTTESTNDLRGPAMQSCRLSRT